MGIVSISSCRYCIFVSVSAFIICGGVCACTEML